MKNSTKALIVMLFSNLCTHIGFYFSIIGLEVGTFMVKIGGCLFVGSVLYMVVKND